MRASLLKAIGLLDEVYFAYAEEDDLEVRARRAGAQLRKIAVPIYHAGGATSKKFPIKASYLQMRNSIRFSIKQRSLWKTMARIGKIIDVACNPGSLFLDPKDNSHLRMRAQGHILTNLAILLCAVGWNVLFLPQTLLIRRRENRRIAAARALLNSPASRPRTGNPPMQAATAAAGAAAPPRTQEISIRQDEQHQAGHPPMPPFVVKECRHVERAFDARKTREDPGHRLGAQEPGLRDDRDIIVIFANGVPEYLERETGLRQAQPVVAVAKIVRKFVCVGQPDPRNRLRGKQTQLPANVSHARTFPLLCPQWAASRNWSANRRRIGSRTA